MTVNIVAPLIGVNYANKCLIESADFVVFKPYAIFILFTKQCSVFLPTFSFTIFFSRFFLKLQNTELFICTRHIICSQNPAKKMEKKCDFLFLVGFQFIFDETFNSYSHPYLLEASIKQLVWCELMIENRPVIMFTNQQ